MMAQGTYQTNRRPSSGLRRGMAHLLLLAAVGLAVVAAGFWPSIAEAEGDTGTPAPPSGLQTPADVPMSAGDTVDLDGGSLQISNLAVVEDSRCPMNVMCVWMGRAVVTVDVTVDGVSQGSQKLTLFPARRVPVPSPDLDAVVDRYILSLADVQPYPVAGGSQPLDQKTATISVTAATP
jgi:hypothetical protein